MVKNRLKEIRMREYMMNQKEFADYMKFQEKKRKRKKKQIFLI